MSKHYIAVVGLDYKPVGSHKPVRVEAGSPARRLPARAIRGLLADGLIRVQDPTPVTPATPTEGE